MKKIIPLIITLLLAISFSPAIGLAETKTFIKEYTYQASEYDSKVTCRTLALEQVKRLLLEELGTYLESETEVKNFQLTKDQIVTITAGIVHALVIDEKWDGKAYYLTAKIEADPKEVEAKIYAIRQDRQKMKQIEALSKTIAEQSQQIEKLKNELNKSSKDKKKIKKYDAAVKKLASPNFFESREASLYLGEYSEKFPDSYKQEAIDYFNKLIKQNHKDAKAHLGRARAYKNVGDYQNALKDFNQSIDLNPRNEHAYYYRSVFYFNIKEYRKGITDLSKAIDLSKDPKQTKIWLRVRAAAYTEYLDEYQKAIIDLDKCIELDKDYPDEVSPLTWSASAYAGRGIVFFTLGNYNQAIKEFDKAIAIDPKYLGYYVDRGLAYTMSGNPQLAIIDYDKVIEVIEYHATILRDLSKKAGIPYERGPNATAYKTYLRRAGAYSTLGDVNRVTADYTNAIDCDPMNPDAYYLRGLTYYINGNKGKGIEDIKAAARLGLIRAQDYLRKEGIAW